MDWLNFFSHTLDLLFLIIAAILGNLAAIQVKKHYLIKKQYNKQSVLIAILAPLAVLLILFALLWDNQNGLLLLIEVSVFYAYYLYSSFAHSPPEFQNQDVLRFFKKK